MKHLFPALTLFTASAATAAVDLSVVGTFAGECVEYARSRAPGLPSGLFSFDDKLKIINSQCKAGAVAIIEVPTGESKQYGHVAYVEKCDASGITLIESNYRKGKITRRSVAANFVEAEKQLKIKGYWAPVEKCEDPGIWVGTSASANMSIQKQSFDRCDNGLAAGRGNVAVTFQTNSFFGTTARSSARYSAELSGPFANGALSGLGQISITADNFEGRLEGDFKQGKLDGNGSANLTWQSPLLARTLVGEFRSGQFYSGTMTDEEDTSSTITKYVNGSPEFSCRSDKLARLERNCTTTNRDIAFPELRERREQAVREAQAAIQTRRAEQQQVQRAAIAPSPAAGTGEVLNCNAIAYARNTPTPTPAFAKYAFCMKLIAQAGQPYFKILSFNKTDGQSAEFAKVQSYKLYFSAETIVTQTTGTNDCKQTADYWGCLNKAINQRAKGMNPGKVTAGARDTFKGYVTFEKFESGWKYNSVSLNGRM